MSVAIIGGGPAGIVSAKSALECGLEPTVFEKGDGVGGLWKPKSGSVWDRMKTNISHHTCLFSDFPWNQSTSDFPTQSEVNAYLESYAEHFKLKPHLQMNTSIRSVEKSNEKWLVMWIHDGQSHSKTFDYVLVCSGIFSKAYIPQIPGSENFGGPILHAKDYKTPEAFRERRVAVVGNAFSGCEITAELAPSAKSVTNIFHRAMWILPRYLPSAKKPEQKLPLDLIFYSRAANARSQGVPAEELNARKSNWFRGLTKQGEKCPELAVETAPSSSQFVVISDAYTEQVEAGKIALKKGSIERMEQGKLIFKDGSALDADAVIFCTGYQTEIPFFSKDILSSLDFDPADQLQPLLLHKTVFHPNLPGIAFIGMYRGPFFGILELQSRWACMALSKKITAPSKQEMENGIQVERQIREARPRPQFPHGDYVNFADDLARQIGALPDWKKFESENPSLHNKLWEGPLTAASYRLTGFGSNPDVALPLIDRINQAAS